jgi:hypothetical protein
MRVANFYPDAITKPPPPLSRQISFREFRMAESPADAALTIAIKALTTVEVHMATCVEANRDAAQMIRSLATETKESIRRVHERVDEIHEERITQIEAQRRDGRVMIWSIIGLVVTNLVTIGLHFIP